MKCPITGKKLVSGSILSNNMFPEVNYSAQENPPGLNDRIRAAGYNPTAYYEHDGAVPAVAELVDDGGKVLATVEPSRDRGKFGGWLVKPIAPEFSSFSESISWRADWRAIESATLRWLIP